LGGGDRQRLARVLPPLPDHLPVDAAALLGAVAVARRRLCACAGTDAAGGRGSPRDAAPDRALFAAARARWLDAMAVRQRRLDLRRDRRRRRAPHDRAFLACEPRAGRGRGGPRRARPVLLFDPLSVHALCDAPRRARIARSCGPSGHVRTGDAMAREPDRVTLTPEQQRRRRARSIAIALALGA